MGHCSRFVSALAFLVAVSCSPDGGPEARRVAILPANILIGTTTAYDWIGLGAAVVLQQDLSTTRSIVPVLAGSESAMYEVAAAQVLRATVELREGRLRVQATLADVQTGQVRRVTQAEGSSEAGFLPLLNAVAKQFNSQSASFSTRSDKALGDFTAALAATDTKTRTELLTAATNTDSRFGLARIALIETLAQTKSGNLNSEIAAAMRAKPFFTPLDARRLDALLARLSDAPLGKKAATLQAILDLAPYDADALAALGSMQILEGQLKPGEQLLRKAVSTNPGNGNLQRQLAQGLINAGNYAEAERTLGALPNRQSFLPQIATAILLGGDKARANAVFDEYLQSRSPGDPLVSLLKANWWAVTGDVSMAIATLSEGGFSNPVLESVSLSETSLWQLYLGERAASKRTASSLTRLPGPFSEIALLLSRSDEDPEQWRREVLISSVNTTDKQLLLGYGFFLSNHFQQAQEEWRKILTSTGNSDLESRTMLAASLDRAGNRGEAQKVRLQAFVPDLGNLYSAVCFNEYRRLASGLKVE